MKINVVSKTPPWVAAYKAMDFGQLNEELERLFQNHASFSVHEYIARINFVHAEMELKKRRWAYDAYDKERRLIDAGTWSGC